MTSSAGTSGSIFAGSPPRSAIASRIAARSTTAGTPVKSCITTRAGVKAISSLGSALASHVASASMSAAVDRRRCPRCAAGSRAGSSARTAAARRRTSTAARRAGRSRARGRRPSACRGRRRSSGCRWGHGSWSFQASAGSTTKAAPSGVGRSSEVRGRSVAMRCVRSTAGERDERGVGRGRGSGCAAGDGERLAQRVGPPADGVGAALEVAPQRVAAAAPPRSATRWSISATRQRRGDEVLVERRRPARRRGVVGRRRVVERERRARCRATTVTAEARLAR